MLYRETLELREKILDQEHPDTLESINNLARVLKNQEKYNEAKALYGKSALPSNTKV